LKFSLPGLSLKVLGNVSHHPQIATFDKTKKIPFFKKMRSQLN